MRKHLVTTGKVNQPWSR